MNEMKRQKHSEDPDKKPFFSVVIPIYNAEAYLRECLESICAQDFEDWEAILVDDGSSDSSTAIATEFQDKDPRITLYRSERNSGGAFLPRLRGASSAQGKYIVTVDADDTIDSDLLRTLHQAGAAAGTDLIIPEMWRFSEASSYKYLPSDSIDADATWRGSELVGHTLVKWDIPMCGFAVRRETYLKAYSHVDPDEGRSIFADELLSRWILFLSNEVRMCASRYHYRHNTQSVTNINVPRIIESRLQTADSLIRMTSSTFGAGSATYTKALENKLYKAVDMLRLINASRLSPAQQHTCVRLVSDAMKGFDLNSLKGKTSPRYLVLMSLPLPTARRLLKIIDPIIKKKNGI